MSFRADPQPQDWARLVGHCAAVGHRLWTPSPARQFAGGLANLNYLVRLDGRPAVLRRPPPGPRARGASDMAREAAVLTALAPVWELAPRLLLAELSGTVIDAPFLILEYRPGIGVGGVLVPPITVADGPWLVDLWARVLASLHRVETGGPAFDPLRRPGDFGQRQLRGWTKRADEAFGADAPPALGGLLAMLERAAPDLDGDQLLHMDPKLDNLLVDPGTRMATALIDWDMGTLGPAGFDLAVLLSYWILPDDPPATHALDAVPSCVEGWPSRAAVIEAYGRAAGGLPAHLPWLLALARLRLAVAWRQLYRLWQQGALVGERYAGFDRIAAAILAMAADRFGEA